MHKNKRIIIAGSILTFALISCNLLRTVAPTIDANAISTQAAMTIAAAVEPTNTISTTNTIPPTHPTDTPIADTQIPPTDTSAAPTAVCDQAEFVSETIPDGTEFSLGDSFTKSWRLKNTGSCTWTTSYSAVFVSGDPLGAPPSVPFTGNVAPGQEVDVMVDMTAPTTPGTYIGNWMLRNASGVLFGLGPSAGIFLVKIVVPSPTPTYTPTNTPPGSIIIVTFVPIGPIFLNPTVQQVYGQVSIGANATGHASVNCPSGSLVVGGGFAGSTEVVVYNSSAQGNGWNVYAKNNYTGTRFLNAYAECLSFSSGSTQQVYAQVNVSANANGHASVNCPSGSIVTGGGFAGNTDLFVYNSSASGNGWNVYAKNTSGSNKLLNAYAVCLSGTSATSQQIYAQSNIPANNNGDTIKACPSGSLVTGGGFAGNTNVFVYSTFSTSNSWQAYAANTSGSTQLLNAYAICTTFP